MSAGHQRYRWPDGKKAAAVISLDFDGPSPYLWKSRNAEAALLGELEQRRFGPRQGIFRLLDLFSQLDMKASVYVPGAVAKAHPDTIAEIVHDGHEVGLHGYMHEHIPELEPAEFARVLEKSVLALEAAGCKLPLGHRSPSWELTASSLAVLEDFEIAYDSSLMGMDHPYWISKLCEVPVQWALDDAIFYRYVPGSQWPPVSPREVVEAWKLELEGAREYGSLFVLTMHPWMSGRSGRMVVLREFLEEYRFDPEIWWATASEVAQYHASTYPDSFREIPRPGEV